MRGESSGLRVATLNVWARHGDWPARRAVLAAGFAELEPDLVALQETIVTPDGEDQVEEILGDGYHIVHQQERDRDGLGVSIASRWGFRRVQELDLHVTPRTGEFPCVALIAEIEAPEPTGTLVFANHFPNWQLDQEYERELQTVMAARAIERLVATWGGQAVLAGDLDADPEAASARFLAGRQSLHGMSVCYRDAWASAHPDEPGPTFTPDDNPLLREQQVKEWRPFVDWPFRRIDQIFVRLGSHQGAALHVRSCRRIFDAPVDGVWASDHFGVTADLVPPPA